MGKGKGRSLPSPPSPPLLSSPSLSLIFVKYAARPRVFLRDEERGGEKRPFLASQNDTHVAPPRVALGETDVCGEGERHVVLSCGLFAWDGECP